MATRNILRICLFLSFVLLMLAVNVHADDEMELWVHPYLPATELIKKFSPLATYLGENIGRSIQVKVSKKL